MSRVSVVMVTGMSGAGRSTALNVLEDLGFFCVDNLPPSLAAGLLSLLDRSDELGRVALGVDVRTGAFLEGAGSVHRCACGRAATPSMSCSSTRAMRRSCGGLVRPGVPHPLAPGR